MAAAPNGRDMAMAREEDCIRLLQQVLPRFGYDWHGFRKVHRTVCKRLRRRARALRLPDLQSYADVLEHSPAERAAFDAACRIPISRFARDREVFRCLQEALLPELAEAALARGDTRLRCWSAGCAMGQEPYSLVLLWRTALSNRYPGLQLHVVATDTDEASLARAAAGCYRPEALRGMPERWLSVGFATEGEGMQLKGTVLEAVTVLAQDIRRAMPEGPFDLILCRNLVFTYFDSATRERLLPRIVERLRPDGALVLGRNERLPSRSAGLSRTGPLPVYRRAVSSVAAR